MTRDLFIKTLDDLHSSNDKFGAVKFLWELKIFNSIKESKEHIDEHWYRTASCSAGTNVYRNLPSYANNNLNFLIAKHNKQ